MIYILEEYSGYDGVAILAVFDSEDKAIKSAQSRVRHKLQWETHNESICAQIKPGKKDLFNDHFFITGYKVQ